MNKYYKHKDGRRKEREPTERERREEVFPGIEDMTKLAKGITSENEEEKAETFSKRWKEFATGRELEDKVDNLIDLNDDVWEELRDVYRGILEKNPDFTDQLSQFLKPMAKLEKVEEASKKKIEQGCNRYGYYSFAYFLNQLDVINRSQAGRLNK